MRIRHYKPTTQISLIALLTAYPALGQEVITLSEISLSANYAELEIDRTGVSVEVVNEDEIDKSGEVKLSNILTTLPGINADANGPMGGVTSVSIRGARSENISVFKDGIRIDDPTTVKGGFNFGSLSSNNISRIEVLRGSQSAIYGGSAIGGVIDITSSRPTKEGFSGSVSAEYGSYQTYNGALSLNYLSKGTEAYLNLSHAQSEGFSAYDEAFGATENDGFKGQEFSLGFAKTFDNDFTIGINGFYIQSEYDFDDIGADNPENNGKDTQTGGRIFVEYDNDAMMQKLSYAQTELDRKQYTTTFGPYTYETTGTRQELRYHGSSVLQNGLQLNYGGEYRNEETQVSDGTNANSDSIAAIAGLNYAFLDQLNLELSGRYENHASFGNLISSRASLAWQAMPDLILRGVASTGFRAPTSYELHDPYYGNPNLKPETSVSYELGIEKKFGDQGSIGLTAFQITSENYLDYDSTTFKAVNIPGKTTRQGLEFNSEYAINDQFTLGANYTYTATENAAGQQLPRIPKHLANIYADAQITDAFNTRISAKYAGGNLDRVYGVENKLDDYIVVNAHLGYDIGPGQAYLNIENLFNEQYQTAYSYGTSDRAFYVGYKLDF